MVFKPTIKSDVLLSEVKIIAPDIYREKRGSIWTSFSSEDYDGLVPQKFNHDKFSISKRNVLRGIHGDHKSWKLVSCPYGDILAVIVDLRMDSPTYMQHSKYRLNAENNFQILIPPSFGNSFYVLSEEALYHYKFSYLGDYIDAEDQFTISWNDPRLGIEWPTNEPILSDRDAKL